MTTENSRLRLLGGIPTPTLPCSKLRLIIWHTLNMVILKSCRLVNGCLQSEIPFILGTTVTAGIVSAKGRDLNILETEYRIESFIQTDAALNPGNSGGALVDTKGLLVGITSAIYSPNGAYAGYSFAIPVSIVRKVVEDLREFGEVQSALIGVNIRDVTQRMMPKNRILQTSGVL